MIPLIKLLSKIGKIVLISLSVLGLMFVGLVIYEIIIGLPESSSEVLPQTLPSEEIKKPTSDTEESSSSFLVNLVIFLVLIEGVALIIRKITKNKGSETIKKQSVGSKTEQNMPFWKKLLKFLGISFITMSVIFFFLSLLVLGIFLLNPDLNSSTSTYFDRATLQCGTFCDSKELFLDTQVTIMGNNSLYNCTCIKDFGEPYQKVVGSRIINNSQLSEDEKLIKKVEPFINASKTSDVNIRAKAGQIVRDCPSGDRECSVNAVYRYITEELRYVHDPKSRQIIQTPEETLAINGGDCEDLSILMNSYLENLGIETATVLTPDHAYAAACNLDTTILQQYATKSLNDYTIKQLTKSVSTDNDDGGNNWNVDFVTIDDELYYKYTLKDPVEEIFNGPGSYWWWTTFTDFNTSYFESVRIDYKVRADDNVYFYVLNSEEELSGLMEGNAVEGYVDCRGYGIFFSGSCKDLGSFGGIGLVNSLNSGKSRVTLDLKYYLKPKPENNFKSPEIITYNLNKDGVQCVVLDPTQGSDGYPGSDRSVNATRVMVTNVAKEVKDFGFLNYCTSNNYC